MSDYYVSFLELLICFVIKLENIQAVNYVETLLNWNNGLLLILTPNNTDLSQTCHC